MFLVGNGADIEALNITGESPLALAFKKRNREAVVYLFNRYASVSSLASTFMLFRRLPKDSLKNRVDGLVVLFESAGLPTDLAKLLVQYVTEK